MHDGIIERNVGDGLTRQNAPHGFAEDRPLVFAPEIIGDEKATAQQVFAQARGLCVRQFDQEMGGLSPEEIRNAKMILWKGHCSVHQMFQPEHIDRWRAAHPNGHVISHPECGFEVCKASDYVGSTEMIIKTVAAAPAGTEWLVGTELNLVTRIAEEFKPQGKLVQFMAPTVCMCSTMARIDPQHLCWTLENLAAGRVVNRITVPEPDASLARVALDRMLAVS